MSISLCVMPHYVDFCPSMSMDFCPLSENGSIRYKMRMSKNFRDAFLAALNETGLTVAEVARRAGVSKDQLNKLKQREAAKTNVDDAKRVAAAFGSTLDEFLDGQEPLAQSELIGLLSQLGPQERDFLLKSARALASPPNSDTE